LYLRRIGVAKLKEERAHEVEEELKYKPKLLPLYQV